LNEKNVGESVFLYHVFSESLVPVNFILGTLSAIREIKKYDGRIKTLSNGCSYETISKKVSNALKKTIKVKKPVFKSVSLEFKRSNDSEIDKTRILAHRDAFRAKVPKKIIIKDREIFFKPTSKKPFLEAFYLMGLRYFK